MKLKLSLIEEGMVIKVYPSFDIKREYDEDEIIELYELIYDKEASYANTSESEEKYDEYMKLAREYAALGDKLQDLANGK